MTDSNSDSEQSPAVVAEPASPKVNEPAPAPVVVKSGGKGLGIFAILLSLAALGGSGYTWFETQVKGVQQESRLAVGVSEIGAQVSRLGDSITRIKQDQADVVTGAELDSKILGVTSSVESQLRDMTAEQKAVQDSVTKLNAELQRGVDQFTIEEVSQLLRIANNSVLFSDDIEAATNALTLADNQLKTLRDPRFARVRTAINSELAALRGVTLPDTEAISAQLNSLAKTVVGLPLANEPDERTPEPVAAEPEAEITVRGELVKIWRDLIGSVSIQRVDQPPKPLLVPEQRYFLNENIRLSIAKAELALLQGEASVYQRSLNDAGGWLREYFDLKNAEVQTTLKQLDALSSASIKSEVPSITGSYQALQTILGGQ